MIQLCKAAGFSLDEIAELYGDSAPGRPASRALAEAKLRSLDDQIAALTIAREILELGLRCSCRSLDECRCDVHTALAALVPAG